MDAFIGFLQNTQPVVLLSMAVGLLIAGVFVVVFHGRRHLRSNEPPAVPGLPLIGNLLQLKEKKPHQTFAKWAEKYGPIYSIKTGASKLIVLNSTQVAKEAMVAKFSSISTRKLSKALTILTCDKKMVATSDYDDFHKLVKRCIITNLLGAGAQKQLRGHRDVMVSNMIENLETTIKENPSGAVNFRDLFKDELFRLALKEALGQDIESIYVPELGKELTKKDLYNVLVVDPMTGAIEVDWRDFFPYLRWVPNSKWEEKIQRMASNKYVVMKALINEHKRRIQHGEGTNSYLKHLLSLETLTEEHLISLVWEVIIEASDTTAVITEWAMYQLAKNPDRQDRLYDEIKEVCGTEKVTEEHLPQLHYLNCVFHETLRRHSPVPIVPLRFVHEDTQLGGFDIPAEAEIAINLYACNMNKEEWAEPDEWRPERFLEGTHEFSDLYKTMAFGAGKRACAGSIQAMLITCISIARFVQGYGWRLVEGDEDKVDTVQLTAQRLQPLCVYVKPRK
ncbi:ent-kaurene oxidase [Carex littledalei]|uniref:Ent-kaurene oxidase n=1 Tax=Carex littledalei TaxID=544730 RepID=A0A833R8P7_9POAL|nr:ent-kaurene oxidase [Carex littledalei]